MSDLLIWPLGKITKNVRNYILPARSQCWEVCLSPIFNTPSSSAAPLSQALVDASLDFEVVSIVTTFDPSTPSFVLQHDRRENLDWTNKQRGWAEQGEEVQDIEDLQLKVRDILSLPVYLVLSLKFNSWQHFIVKVARRRILIFAYLCRPSQGELLI